MDFMYTPNPAGYYTDPSTYYDPKSFDEDYEEYNVGFPEDAEDLMIVWYQVMMRITMIKIND